MNKHKQNSIIKIRHLSVDQPKLNNQPNNKGKYPYIVLGETEPLQENYSSFSYIISPSYLLGT